MTKDIGPGLECWRCGKTIYPIRENKDGSLRYECNNYEGHEACHGGNGSEKWTILSDGSIKE